MAISYLSKTVQSHPYIQPFDLGLMQQLNQYKQTNFYKNASALRSEYSAIQNSQIYNPEQKEYFTKKFNSLMQSVSDLGAVDYSDMNVTNTLENIGSSIYDDDIIMNGISQTKKIMANQAGWEKISTDPKLNKYYSPQNKAWDDQQIQKYVQGGLHATYDGPASPTLYNGNPFEKLTAKIKDLQPDITVGIDPNTHKPYFLDSTNKTLSAERIQALMQGTLDPGVLNQIKIDSWYNGQGITSEDLFKTVDGQHKASISSYNDAIEQAKQAQRTSIGGHDELQKQIDQLTANRDALDKDYDPKAVAATLQTENGRQHYIQQMYTKQLFDDATTAYKYTQLSEKLQNLGGKTAAQKAALKGKTNQFGQQLDENGNPIQAPLMEPATTFLDEDETKKQAITTESLSNLATKEQETQNEIYRSYFLRNGGGKYEQYYTSIANLDGDPNFSFKDLQIAHSNPAKLAKLQLTEDAQGYFNNMWTALTLAQNNAAASVANPKDELDLNDAQQTMDALRKSQIQQQWAQTTLQQAKKDALTVKAGEKGLTVEEFNAYKRAVANPTKYFNVEHTDPSKTAMNPRFNAVSRAVVTTKPDSPAMARAFQKMGVKNNLNADPANLLVGDDLNINDDDVNKVLSRQSKARNPYTVYLDPKAVAKSSGAFASLLTNGVGIIDGTGEPIRQVNALPEDIRPVALQKIPIVSDEYDQGMRYMVKFRYKEGKNVPTGYKYITGEQANAVFDVPVETNNPIDDIFNATNQLPERRTIIPYNSVNKNTNLITSQVVRRGNNPIQVVFKIPNTSKEVAISDPGNGQGFQTAAQADAFAENLSRTLVNYPDSQSFLSSLAQYKNQVK
jgi:hypothetical protein